LWFLGLVVRAGVEDEFSEKFAGFGVDDADVSVVDEQPDALSFVFSADADVVQFRVVTQGDHAGVVDAVVADAPVPVGAGRGRFASCGISLGGCSAVQ
jgi:hypothetical protein